MADGAIRSASSITPLAGSIVHGFGGVEAVPAGSWVMTSGLMLAALFVRLDISPRLVMPGLFLGGIGKRAEAAPPSALRGSLFPWPWSHGGAPSLGARQRCAC